MNSLEDVQVLAARKEAARRQRRLVHHVGIAIKGGNPARYWQTQRCGVPFLPDIPDPTPVVVQFCRRHGMEVFGCIRMNDCHDAFGLPFDRLVYPLKAESPHPGESSSAPGGAEPPVSRWRCHFRRKSTRRSNYR
ncbi:MAG: hypothetical protein QF792_06845 [Phycisphaerae bacterium]|jgi:hypothetical protein|nr:hypothetical protein [Phycisphaerae bacterium]